MTTEEPRTISVPEAGRRYFGISRNAAYEAARSGLIPTIRVGHLLRVPVAAMERKLNECGQTPTPAPVQSAKAPPTEKAKGKRAKVIEARS